MLFWNCTDLGLQEMIFELLESNSKMENLAFHQNEHKEFSEYL